MPFFTGKRPASFRTDTVRYTDVATNSSTVSLPNPPFIMNWGYGEDFVNGPQGWKMLGNGPCDDGTISSQYYAYNGVGDCGWAFFGHAFMQEDKQAKRPISNFTSASTVNNYAEYLGLQNYTQINQNNDQGTDLQEGLQRVQSVGFTDADGKAHKIVAYASLEVGNMKELWQALYLGNSIMLGIQFPESADIQTQNGQIWSVVPGAQIVGGHCISLCGHPREDVWTVITWGQRQTVTQQFLQTYMDEAYMFVSAEQYNAVTGDSPQNYTEADIEKFLSMLGTVR